MSKQIKILVGLVLFFGLAAGVLAGLLFYSNSHPGSGLDFLNFTAESVSKGGAPIEIDRAVQEATQRHPEVLAYTIYAISIDHVDFSPDGSLALAWLTLTDKQTGKLVPAEPGLSIVVKTSDPSSPAPVWKAYLQADAEWNEQMALVPADMLNEEARIQFTSPEQPIAKAAPFTGYRLPWAKGQTKILTGSIGHVFTYKSCPSSCLYAFDFADGTMFQIMAAKGGIVKEAVWTYANGNTTNANYLLVQDNSTSPVSYMIYMHLAQNSIPEALRVPGAVINQGQYIGNADDTGYSTGHHLHFHVHTNPLSYWGNSVDIVFEDVAVNGGRPRTCTEAGNYPEYGSQCQTNDAYTSSNADNTPPYGGLTLPQAGQTINTASITVTGWGQDNIAVARLQPVVNYDGIWRPVGSSQTGTSYNAEVNLCEAGVPDGPLSIGLMVYDRAGNPSATPQGQRVLTKEYACEPQPAICQPSDNEAAIFVNKDFQGPCQILQVGNYSDLGNYPTIGGDNLESIMVGKNVTAAVFDGESYKDRIESFAANDDDLADNLIGLNHASSIRILKNPVTPAAPVLIPPSAAGNKNPISQDSLTLAWQSSQGAVDYRSELTGSNGFSSSVDWNKADSWSVGSLPAGDYNWTVYGRNGANQNQASLAFSIKEASLSSQSPLTVPYKADFESTSAGWTSTGFWKRSRLSWGELQTTAWFTGSTSSYGSDGVLSADLTSPVIQIPYEGLALQFSYFTETEGVAVFRDQRRVQISQDGGPFQDVLQILDSNPAEADFNNASVDLTPYAGHSIRVRFHFDAVDAFYNDYFGWAVDNVRIDANVSQLCGQQSDDETPQNASPLEIGARVDGSLCPEGDVDVYKISASKDQKLTAILTLPERQSSWEPLLTFISADGKTILADSASDQSAPYSVTITAPASEVYYLKVSASQNGDQSPDAYSLQLISDSTAPQITMLAPTADQPLTGFPFTISLEVSDGSGSGVAAVEFWWHSKSWANDKWQLLGTDDSAVDGWSWIIPSDFAEPAEGAALFLRASDNAENYRSVTISANPLDSAPSSHLLPLPETTASTAVQLKWEADANAGSIQNFRIQYRESDGEWTNLDTPFDSSARQAWFTGLNGQTYRFRLSAVDLTGREETWPDEAEASTTIEPACAPDSFENADQSQEQAETPVQIELNRDTAERNFCGAGDVDWFEFNAAAEKSYTIESNPVSGGAAAVLQVLASDRQTVVAEAAALDLSSKTILDWQAPADGQYYLRVSALNPGLSGTSALYTVKVQKSGAFSVVGMVCTASLIPALLFLVKIFAGLFKKQNASDSNA